MSPDARTAGHGPVGPDLEQARRLLRTTFGHDDFRPGQERALRRILAGEELVIVMPTGAGKSACYQVPGLLWPGLTLVVSPLIALMKDQVESLQAAGVRADFVNSSIPPDEQARRLEAAADGRLKLLYVAPERLGAPRFLRALESARLALVAVDEAHCISQWGHDFRPAYDRGLREFLQRVRGQRGPRVVAFTATATPRVRVDVTRVLGMPPEAVLVTGFRRDELRLVSRRHDTESARQDQVTRVVAGVAGSGIVYCPRRRDVEDVTGLLQRQGEAAVAYHAGLPDDERARVQEEFLRGEARVIVATNAFGMGIDKPDIRFVVHAGLPGSLEAYYQEIGRAGRDGGAAYCVLVHAARDRHLHEFFLDGSCPPPESVMKAWDALASAGEGTLEWSREELAGAAAVPEIQVTAILRLLEDAGLVDRLDDRDNPAQVRFLEPPRRAASRSGEGTARRAVADWLLEAHAPTEGEVLSVRAGRAAADLGLARPVVLRALRELAEAGLVELRAPFRGRGLVVRGGHLRRRAVERRLEPALERSARLRQLGKDRIDRMQHYAHSRGCRHRFLLDYFGEEAPRSCASCDNCRGWSREDPAATRPAARGRRGRRPPAARVLTDDDLAAAMTTALRGAGDVHGRFGLGVLRQVLRGSRAKKVRAAGLEASAVHGALSGLGAADVDELLDGLRREGLIETTEGPYPLVVLTEDGRLRLERAGR